MTAPPRKTVFAWAIAIAGLSAILGVGFGLQIWLGVARGALASFALAVIAFVAALWFDKRFVRPGAWMRGDSAQGVTFVLVAIAALLVVAAVIGPVLAAAGVWL